MGISSAMGSQALVPAGFGFRNLIINGDFRINQRVFTSTTTSDTYGQDRWRLVSSGGCTYSAESFTIGNAISGNEPEKYARLVTTGQSGAGVYSIFQQRIEGVRSLAGQTATVSFFAKANSGTPSVFVELEQQFGTGGSPSSAIQKSVGKVAISTTWTRYTLTVDVPSISGKTIGSNNNDFIALNLWVSAGTDYNTRTGSLGIQSATFDFWGVQVEANNVPTSFEQRPIGVELALCQRYYQRFTGTSLYSRFAIGVAESTTYANFFLPMWVPMRTAVPANQTLSYTAIGTTGNRLYLSDGQAITNLTALAISNVGSDRAVGISGTTASGLTGYRTYWLEESSTGDEWIAVSVEL